MMYRVLPLLAIALALFIVAPALAEDAKNAAKDADASTHQGTVVSITADKLIMKAKDGTEHTHNLAADVKTMCDGKACKIEDIKPGMKIRVTTKKDDKKTATRVEALDKNDSFPK